MESVQPEITVHLCIAVPVNVWTPGLHEFRSDFLDESMLRIPPHITICEVQLKGREMETSWMSRIDELNDIGREVPAFSYRLSELFWDEAKRVLFVCPQDDGDRFNWLKRTAQSILGVASDLRDSRFPRLALASKTGMERLILEERFKELNGEDLSLSYRATEVEVYRKIRKDWYLNTTILLKQSDEN